VQTSEAEPPAQQLPSPPGDATPVEAISAAEERFEHWRKVVGAVAAPAAFALVYFVLLRHTALTPQGRRLSAILAAVGVLWVTETIPLPVTALLGASLCIVLGVSDARTVMAPFADPIIFLFMGSFMLARAMEIHRLDRRIALRFLAVPWVGGKPTRVLAGMGAVTAVLSMWVSNTATTAMMLPIALGVLVALHEVRVRGGLAPPGPLDARNWPFATGMMLMVAYAASIGGIGTKVGSPPNLITLGQLERVGITMSFFRWMAVMVPMLCVMYGVLFVLLYALHRGKPAPAADAARAKGDLSAGLAGYLRRERDRLGPWTPGQVNTLIAFAVAVTLWVMPGFIQATLPDKKPPATTQNAASRPAGLTERPAAATPPTRAERVAAFFGSKGQMPEAVVALLAALLLFALPVNLREGQFTLNWKQAANIDWGTLLLFGGGMALGELMFSTGVARALGDWAVAQTGAQGVWSLTAAMIVLGILLSEATSNTASAVMLSPVAISVATQMGVSPIPPALGACLGASYGFMLPVSTAPNAIVFGSGLVPISRMMRAGILFDLIGAVVIWAGLRVLLPAMGLA
jgi:solute carrier family 13 (sodium-dependent dicarboxylate transporter), member 2/3/5